jgi:FMN phosphatase YigB (HAD superfamily)
VPLGAVTFDCWNTLIRERDERAARARRVDVLLKAAQAAGAPSDAATIERVYEECWQEHSRLWIAGVTTGAIECARYSLRALGVDSPEREVELERAWHAAGLEDGAAMLEGADETLAWLAERGMRRALVCDTGFNSAAVVRELLGRHGLLDRLEVLVFSDEAGVPKPNRRVFELALGPLGVQPERALHVGDLRRTDVGGARGFGMRSVRIRAHYDDLGPEPDADHVADSHAALRELLARA